MGTLGPYQGHLLIPGMGPEALSAEHDLLDIVYGSPHLCTFLTFALINGAARDPGNTGNTTVLRPGLIMAQSTVDEKWVPWITGGVNGTGVARGVLTNYGLNTQLDNADADRYLANIMVKGNVNAEALVIAANTAAGIPRTGDGVTIRTQLRYNFSFSDDFICDLGDPIATR